MTDRPGGSNMLRQARGWLMVVVSADRQATHARATRMLEVTEQAGFRPISLVAKPAPR